MSPAEEAREILTALGVESGGTMESRSPIDGSIIGKVAEASRVHTGICPRFEVAPMPKGRAAELMNLGQIPVWAR